MNRPALASLACIALAAALNLCAQGYQFGRSNHTVYLLHAMHCADPGVLANDWFTTQTFQYHALFGVITRGFMATGVLQPAFAAGYVTLLVLLHAAWWRIVRTLGGGAGVFIVSEVLFQLMAAGTGLGMYMFLQDSCFLPSNISAVAMLWGVALRMEGRTPGSAVAFGIAGAFHLNFAPVAIVLWGAFAIKDRRRGTREWVTTLIATLPAAGNIAFALKATAGRSGGMPLAEFIDLYVRLRHPHHYDPSSWPAWLWISFFLPMPFAFLWWRRQPRDNAALRVAMICFSTLMALAGIALAGAGAFYVSESLVQTSLYRFSIYPKLLACVGCAFFARDAAKGAGERALTLLAGAAGVALAIGCIVRGPYLGLFRLVDDSAEYVAACDWIGRHTPADAVFLVPPSEQEFRLRARRAIVVNFKSVPQLSSEMVAWQKRMSDALDLPDLRSLPTPYARTMQSIHDRFIALPPEHLASMARAYGARYILIDRSFGREWESRRVEIDGSRSWFLYDLSK